MTTGPDLVHGAWVRRAASVDDSPPFETQHVVWLQAGPSYADVRVPFHPAAATRCFTGRSGWVGDRYRWTHRLDLEGSDSPAADDVGELTWEDGLLVERGMFPTAKGAVTYVEHWERVPGGIGLWEVQEAPGACLVRVGDHSITALDGPAGFAACYRVLEDGVWRARLSIGETGSLPYPDDTPWPVVYAGRFEAVATASGASRPSGGERATASGASRPSGGERGT
jgi:hypothetical protein